MTKSELKELIKECINEEMNMLSIDEEDEYYTVEAVEVLDESKSIKKGIIAAIKEYIQKTILPENGITGVVHIQAKTFFNKANRKFTKGEGSSIELSIMAPASMQKEKHDIAKDAFNAIKKDESKLKNKVKEITNCKAVNISFSQDSLGWVKMIIDIEE